MRRLTAWVTDRRSVGSRGTIMVMVLVALPVLLLLLLATIELAMRFFYKAQVHSAATAATLAAVGTQVHWPIPIPTRFVYGVPVEGFFINTLHLPNVDNLSGGDIEGEAQRVIEWTGANVKFQRLDVAPGYIPFPVKWVRITASTAVPGVFSKIFRQDTVEDSACGLAWIRPDYWYVKTWWSEKTPVVLGIEDQEFRYYRLIPCGLGGVPDLLEVVAEAHLAATGEDKKDEFETAQNDVANPPEAKGKPYTIPPANSNYDYTSTPAPKQEELDSEHPENGWKNRVKPKTITCWNGSTYTQEPPEPSDTPTPEPTDEELKQLHCPPEPPKNSPPPPADGN
ncbi:MAG: hypothetical protein ACM3XM_02390 [Mycobacterium leprae]